MSPSPELLDRWVAGWCVSRNLRRRRREGGWVVDVLASSRRVEHLLSTPSSVVLLDAIEAVATHPDAWLTIVGELPTRGVAALDRLDPVTHDEVMMTTVLGDGAGLGAVPLDEAVELEIAGHVARASLVVDGVPAARGQIAVHGFDAVADRIETHPDFRRRGLGRRVMIALEGWGAAEGATTGLLIASSDGRRLYSALGWTELAPVATFRGRR